MSEERVLTHTERQFWRESENRWVWHANIRTWGSHKDAPVKWRHRTVTTTTVYSDWNEGKN